MATSDIYTAAQNVTVHKTTIDIHYHKNLKYQIPASVVKEFHCKKMVQLTTKSNHLCALDFVPVLTLYYASKLNTN
jgi:predicted enzyme involved in methoxymalonyl-ACP biosynthesis